MLIIRNHPISHNKVEKTSLRRSIRGKEVPCRFKNYVYDIPSKNNQERITFVSRVAMQDLKQSRKTMKSTSLL